MTTVIATEDRTGVKIAANSRITGYHLSDGWVQKIVKNGDFTFAAAGYLRVIQLLEFAKLPQPPADATPDSTDRFVSLELIPAIAAAFKESDAKAETNGAERGGSLIMVVVRGRIYQIHGGNLSWTRNERGIYGIGSGSDLAIGAVEAGATLEEAIKIAAKYDIYTNSDVKVIEVKA